MTATNSAGLEGSDKVFISVREIPSIQGKIYLVGNEASSFQGMTASLSAGGEEKTAGISPDGTFEATTSMLLENEVVVTIETGGNYHPTLVEMAGSELVLCL